MLLFVPATALAATHQAGLVIRRFEQNPIIRPEMLPGEDGANINGPSLIRVPSWITNRLGSYYLYFAHHSGKYIRLAYADRLEGPWKIHEPGTLKLADAPGCTGHVASPDVHVDEARKEIRMYFHGPARDGSGQKSFVAASSDGLHFKGGSEPLGIFYFRVFRWQGGWFAMGKGGLLYRSPEGLTRFEEGHNPFPGGDARDKNYNSPGPRHVDLHVVGDNLWVYYSNIGDIPERILRSRIRLTEDWKDWKASAPEEVLRPETAYEGVDLPLKPTVPGAMKGRENALRDPGIFADADGRVYLIYSVAGEAGLAMAELTPSDITDGRSTPKLAQKDNHDLPSDGIGNKKDAAPQKSLPLPGEVLLVQGHTAFLILPQSEPTRGPIPWVWYAPTLRGLPGEAEKWMFERFSRAGIAVAGIDVGESYGSPNGRALYSAFYDELTRHRAFAPKAVMLGRSRGGLMTLSWAAENVDKVAGFAGIYPVCNLTSYPGVAKASAAYRMTTEELSARLPEHNPIDRLAALAKAGVPLFAIHGDTDQIVPLEANSGELRKRYEALGGRMQLLVPPGQGHNMWTGFFQCQELVEFVLTQARRSNPTPK